LLLESITASGRPALDWPASLWQEALALRSALARDLREICGEDFSEALTPDAAGLAAGQQAVNRHPAWPEWGELLAGSGEVLLVAPECGGELLTLSLLAIAQGSRLLGSSPAAIHIGGSKARTAAWLAQAGLPVVPTLPLHVMPPSKARGGWVLKPDDGAGALGVRRITTQSAAFAAGPGHGAAIQPAAQPLATESLPQVLQPWVDGPSGSLFVFSHGQQVRLLASSTQHVEWHNDDARLVGLEVNAPLLPWSDARALARRVAGCLPGLCGFWGLDFVCTAAGPLILEVNPRPTSTYPALRESLGWNPARLLAGLSAPAEGSVPGNPIRLGFG